jgi:hypothetical protein
MGNLSQPASTDDSARPSYPTRFGWGMRLFLGVLLFEIVFRSLSVLFPWADWAGESELDMRTMPVRLPTQAEMAGLAEKATTERPHPVADDVMESLDSLWDYWKPWPEARTRAKMRNWTDGGKWGLCWLSSRFDFVENVIGFNQEWPMFSPGVATKKWFARARLVYADGSDQIVRGLCDPDDLTRYSHWFQEKILDHELKIKEGKGHVDDNFGYCNLLSHRYPHNQAGSPLTRIYLFIVRYEFPPPGVDARAWLAEQTGPPAKQVYADFYVFDATTRNGKCLLDKYDGD